MSCSSIVSSRRCLVPAAFGLGVAAAVLIAAAPDASKMKPGHPLAEITKQSMDPAHMEKAMGDWMALMQPTPAHEWLGHFVGEWDVKTSMWMDPSAPPMESTATSTVSWRFPSKWIEESFKGDMMGMPFDGMGLTGFDTVRKQYVSVWIDSMGTGLYASAGSINPEMTTLSMYGEMNEPMTGEMGKMVMYQVTIKDADHHTFEMKEVVYGEPMVMMRMEYTRKK